VLLFYSILDISLALVETSFGISRRDVSNYPSDAGELSGAARDGAD
jgi:hypothetical protein